ncbi:MAG: ATP-binding protein [candidate division WOR-3 bacterium]
MVVAVASGKGGTGKTTVAVNLALALGRCRYLDCDVEEPNGHIFLKPEISFTEPVTKLVPQVDESRCTRCLECVHACAYHALAVLPEQVLIFPELCHGCGLCAWVCPEQAIAEKPFPVGVVETGSAGGVEFVQGRLNVGEPMAVPVVRAVKKRISRDKDTVLDVPPRTSCPVVQSVIDCDFCLLVTEPTPFGLHDLKLAVATVRRLGIPLGVVLNRADIGDDATERYCRDEAIPLLLRIPFDRAIAKAYARGEPLLAARPEYAGRFRTLWDSLSRQDSGGGE